MHRRVHIGISVNNDNFRFNLYWRPPHRQIENSLSIAYSPLHRLDINLKDNKINDSKSFKQFLDIFNVLINVDPIALDEVFVDYLANFVYSSEKIGDDELETRLDQQFS
jgi:hypothetical protein